MNKIQECLKKSLEAKIKSAYNNLNEIKSNGIDYENPMKLLTDGINWKEKFIDRVLQAIIYFLSIPFVLIISLIMNGINYIETINRKREINREIKLLKKQNIDYINYKYVTLIDFWNSRGLNDRKYTEQEQINLIESWINILFSPEKTENLDIISKLNDIKVSNIEANKPYYNGINGAAHYYFQSPIISLIEYLSSELDMSQNIC